MRTNRLAQLSLCAAAAHAFQDTSPFFVFSSSRLPTLKSAASQQVAPSSQISSAVSEALLDCPSQWYIIVSQPEVSTWDFKNPRSAPHLRKRIENEMHWAGTIHAVPEVIGKIEVSTIEQQLMEKCGATHFTVHRDTGIIEKTTGPETAEDPPRLLSMDLASPSTELDLRASQLAKNDWILNEIIERYARLSFTVIYTTTPPSREVLARQDRETESKQDARSNYSWDEGDKEAIHMDLKREIENDLNINKRQSIDEEGDGRALFEKYNFLNAGMFMGLLAAIILMSILYVGITAVGSLQVSYAAFSKEMGPKAQNKQQ